MRRALVTGGASPIGAAICRALAAQGVHVTSHANANLAGAPARADELGGAAIGFDITDHAVTAASLEPLVAEQPFQILVHNAGVHDDAPMAGMSAAQWHRAIAVSLDGFFHATRPLLLPMMATRWGRIVAMASLSGVIGNRGQANYAAAKAGLIGAVKSLSQEVAARGITVNAIAPGIIESPAAEGFSPERIRALVPARRAGTPEEVADLTAFLCSDRAGYISGQCIGINGGAA